jgi:hypothetical protein
VAVRLPNSFYAAIIIFILIGLLYEINLPISVELTRYLEFVLTTDFDMQFITKPFEKLQHRFADFEIAALFQSLPRAAVGW